MNVNINNKTETKIDSKHHKQDNSQLPVVSSIKLISIQFTISEFFGALGDVAILVPLFLAMSKITNFPLSQSLLLVGLFYIWGGLYYRVPMPVQPLKAMAAVVLAQGLPFEFVRWAAFLIAVILLMGSRFAAILQRFFTPAIIKGIQLGLGIMLIQSGWRLIHGIKATTHISPANTGETVLWAIILLVLPQVPLTLGNSIFACADAAKTYFGESASRVTPKSLLTDLGIVNLIAACFGAYPLCHGSGGLTAHRSFGGKTGGAVIIAGIGYLLLSLINTNATFILTAIPNYLLGSSLIYIGCMHITLLRSIKGISTWITSLIAGIIGGLTGNLAWVLIIGCGAECLAWIIAKNKYKQYR